MVNPNPVNAERDVEARFREVDGDVVHGHGEPETGERLDLLRLALADRERVALVEHLVDDLRKQLVRADAHVGRGLRLRNGGGIVGVEQLRGARERGALGGVADAEFAGVQDLRFPARLQEVDVARVPLRIEVEVAGALGAVGGDRSDAAAVDGRPVVAVAPAVQLWKSMPMRSSFSVSSS